MTMGYLKKIFNVSICLPASAQTLPPYEPIKNSTAKKFLQETWHGLQDLLKSFEGGLDGTSVKASITAINFIIELGNTIIDNKDSLEDPMTRTTISIQAVISGLTNKKDAALDEMTGCFVGKLVAELVRLDEMQKQARWKQILDNQKTKNKIEGTFKRIDKHIEDFKVCLMGRISRNMRALDEQLTRLGRYNIPCSFKAMYDTGERSIIRGPCTPDTRTSILADIYEWATNPSLNSPSIFWLTGEAGSGKSTLAYTVAEHFDDDSDILGGSFFCSRLFEETRQQRNIIPTIVYQLARKSRSYAQALLKEDKLDFVHCILSKQINDLLVSPWKSVNNPPYLIVIDALDEISEHGGSEFLEELLDTIHNTGLRGLKFLITSRPHLNITTSHHNSLASKTVYCLHNVSRATKADIMTYLKAELPAFEGDEKLTKIADRADGLFIYAATAVRYVKPHYRMAKCEQLYLMDELLNVISPIAKSPNTRSLVGNLYERILWAAFSVLDDDMFRTRLNTLHTMLCTRGSVSTPGAAALHSNSVREVTDVIVENRLQAVLYFEDDGCIFWYHSSFPDFIFAQTRSKFISAGPTND